jgi:hypothetical protein
MEAALAWFMPRPSGIALPRGKKLINICFTHEHNILENREFVANSYLFLRPEGPWSLDVFKTSSGSINRFFLRKLRET